MDSEQAMNLESANACCAEWMKKHSKVVESRNALRKALKLLEPKVMELQAQNVNLNKAYQEELARANIAKEEKLKESNAKVSLENEVSALRSEISALQQRCGTASEVESGNLKLLQAGISDREKEINRLKELVEKEKIRADSQRKIAENEKRKADEAWKLLEAEKKISEKELQLANIKAVKAEEYRLQQVHLEKEITETKKKLASEMSKLKEGTKRFEAEKQKLLVDKRTAESEMKKAQKQVEVEKQKAAREKQRADAALVNLEEQKKLAEDNWKSATEAKRLADQMSQASVENKKTIEDLKQKIHELSCLRKPNEISGVSPDAYVSSESTKVQLLKSSLELEKLRAKQSREKLKHERKKLKNERLKLKHEESCRSFLQHELHRLKLDFIQNYHHLNMLDASFSPVPGSIHGLNKSQNMPSMQKSDVMTQLCNLGMPQMHNCVENDLIKPCSTNIGACDSLKKSMQNTPLLAISERNYTGSITGIGSKLEPLIRGSDRMVQSYAVNSSTASFSDAHLMGLQERGALQVTAPTKSAEENFNARASNLNPSDRSGIEHDEMKNRICGTVDCLANLFSEGKALNMQIEDKFTSLRGLVYGKVDKCFEGAKEMVTNCRDNLQAESDGSRKKRKKSHREKADISVDEKKEIEGPKARVCEDAYGKMDKYVEGAKEIVTNCRDNLQADSGRARKKRKKSHREKADTSVDEKKEIEELKARVCEDAYGKMDKYVEGAKEMVTNCRDNLQAESDRAHKKRKKSHTTKADTSVDGKKEIEEPKARVCQDADGYRQTTCPALYAQTTEACRERIFDDAFDNFDKIPDGNFMKLLFESADDEERFRKAMNTLCSPPPLLEIKISDMDNLKPSLEEVLPTDLLSQRGLLPSSRCDTIDDEINSNMKFFDALEVHCNAHKSTQARQTDEKLQDKHSLINLRDTFPGETGTGSVQSHLPSFFLVISDREDYSSISRTFLATRNCISRCSLNTRTGWAVSSILAAVEMEETSLQKEKHSVLLTLLLFNFTMTTAMNLGKFGGDNLILCLDSYAEHIRKVMTDADTRILFLEKFSLHDLLRLIEDFLIQGKVIYKNIMPSETSSWSDLRNDSFLDGVDTLSGEVASSEQLVAASVILASLCAATDYVGFISEASYNILRLSRWDSLTVLTILHIFAKLGGKKYFDLRNCGLMVTVLKSLVMFLEEENISVTVTTASGIPPINQLHVESCTNNKCPFSEGAESIDSVTLLLLEKIKNCLFQHTEQFNSSNFRSSSDNYNNGRCSNQEVIPCANSLNRDVPHCSRKHVTCPNQQDVLIDVTTCQVSDILTFLELVAYKMSWQWTNVELVPQLLHILDSCAVENFAVPIVVLLGHLGRLGVDVGGYEDQGVENLRCNLLSYLCDSSKKAGLSLQIAAATALFGLLPLDLETLLQTESSLPAYSSKSISDAAGNLRKWFSGLGKNQQDNLCDILRCTDGS